MSTKLEYYPINIWDDYYEEGYIPEGEIQETYIYVEDSDLSHELRHDILAYLLEYLQTQVALPGVNMRLFFYESRKKYPNLVGTENEWILFDRWEIRVEHLTHERREDLVVELEKAALKYQEVALHIYSNS
jgi:hypothetical protein